MDLKSEYGMDLLLASCPNCDDRSLYCGKIPTKISDLNNREVLFCERCKFVVAVDEYKKILSGA
ncbi:MAG: hypothetical protein GWN01_16725 [Nitrosopumilaceae archaeon]|nr:hypothetical protein [Nitrosopumilaceae archaeon]NIU02478.1 hypothetical protein [Nitrosopumilaceae archaeon]NIU88939.1 hypothetical protein [Nitrosopumilaceae archaeon]NIV67050.1 hypothetical protein [Nitrosopumilaceae archaeon]NIX63079.1 hypothetical protein [Nitrosopumilaceae archaeon]